MNAVVCVGESGEERARGRGLEVVLAQLAVVAAHVSNWDRIVLAYQPVWDLAGDGQLQPEVALTADGDDDADDDADDDGDEDGQNKSQAFEDKIEGKFQPPPLPLLCLVFSGVGVDI
jgi:hypothetical protein